MGEGFNILGETRATITATWIDEGKTDPTIRTNSNTYILHIHTEVIAQPSYFIDE